MSRRQRGEVMVAMMLVVLLVALAGRGHSGMMGHSHGANQQGGASDKASTSEPAPAAPPSAKASGHQH